MVAVDAERAEVEYDELFEDEAGTAKLREWQRFAVVRPPPPVLSGFMHKLRPGTMCELWHDGGWWEVAVIDRKKGSGGGLALEDELLDPPPALLPKDAVDGITAAPIGSRLKVWKIFGNKCSFRPSFSQ